MCLPVEFAGFVGEGRDSVSDVIALLQSDEQAVRGGEQEAQSSDSGTDSSQPGEYEESDE